MNQLTEDVSDAELLAAARKAYPRYRYAIEERHVFGAPGECEIRLLTAVINEWKVRVRARSRIALLLMLNSRKDGIVE